MDLRVSGLSVTYVYGGCKNVVVGCYKDGGVEGVYGNYTNVEKGLGKLCC